ncbi:MAG TPA: hypothetical protein VD970_05630, partial [Acetobacteraceae bacterium]|nr:hypothetical protein [Acetobacteraceae bacterium]
ICIHHWTKSWESATRLKRFVRLLPERYPAMKGPVRTLDRMWQRLIVMSRRLEAARNRAAHRD